MLPNQNPKLVAAQHRRRTREINARLEDLAYMANMGETSEGAAKRLGLTYQSLERWAAKYARTQWHQLRFNDQAGFGSGMRQGKLTVAR